MSESHLRDILDAGLKAVETDAATLNALPEKPSGRCILIGAGKASAKMASVIEKAWPDVDLAGVVATRYGHGSETKHITIIEAGHPYPDQNSLKAGKAVMQTVSSLSRHDTVIALISGGGSACLAVPNDGLSLKDKNRITRELLACGAPISEINTIRKCLSKIKGGKLARLCSPAKLISLVISDIPGDALADVASGPTITQPVNLDKARELLKTYNISYQEKWLNSLSSDADHPSDIRMVASPKSALTAMEERAKQIGYQTINLGDLIEMDTRQFANNTAKHLAKLHSEDQAIAIISGGETSITLKHPSPGKGGPNTEFILSLLQYMQTDLTCYAAAIDSDGYDGSADAAGAMITPEIITRIKKSKIELNDYLSRHDSYSFFEQFEANIKTGPTYTNVNDLRVVLTRTI